MSEESFQQGCCKGVKDSIRGECCPEDLGSNPSTSTEHTWMSRAQYEHAAKLTLIVKLREIRDQIERVLWEHGEI